MALEKITSLARFEELWPQIYPLILRCVKQYPEFEVDSVEDIAGLIARNEQILYLDTVDNKVRGMVLGQPVRYVNSRTFRLNCCAGELDSSWFEELLPAIMEEVKELSGNQIDHFEILGRPGWKKKLEGLGFKMIQMQYVMRN